MKHSVLDLTILLSLFGTGFTFLKNTPFPSGSRVMKRMAPSMAAPSSSLGGLSYRVSNLQQSINFYTTVFGMKLVESNVEATRAKLTMDSEEDGQSAMTLQLLAGLVGDSSEIGDAYSGFGIKVTSAVGIFEAAAAAGGKTLLELGNFAYAASLIPDEDEMKNYPVRYGRISDPDGYTVEVREDPKMKVASRKMFKLTLNVLDIEESVAFYRDVLGMTVLRRRSNVFAIPRHASMCAFMGYSNEVIGPYIELHYNYAVEKLEMGSGFAHASFVSPDLARIAENVKAAGKVVGIVTEATSSYIQISDPSEYQIMVSGV